MPAFATTRSRRPAAPIDAAIAAASRTSSTATRTPAPRARQAAARRLVAGILQRGEQARHARQRRLRARMGGQRPVRIGQCRVQRQAGLVLVRGALHVAHVAQHVATGGKLEARVPAHGGQVFVLDAPVTNTALASALNVAMAGARLP